MSWNDERVELLRKLWTEGLSASQIAAELGGVTRNAVIGKVHRLGLSGRAKNSTPSNTQRVKRAQKPAAFPQRVSRTANGDGENGVAVYSGMPERTALVGLTAPEALRLQLTELTELTCKWPIGDPALEDFYFCGHGTRESSPYCPYHSRLAFQQAVDRRRDRRPAFA